MVGALLSALRPNRKGKSILGKSVFVDEAPLFFRGRWRSFLQKPGRGKQRPYRRIAGNCAKNMRKSQIKKEN